MAVSSWIRRQFKNGVSTTDTVPLGFTSGATSFVAADGSTFPDGSTGDFIITADQGLATEERILMASRSGSTFTVASSGRGYNGTTAFAHGAGCSILHTTDQQDFDEANQVAVATLGQIAAGGDLLYGTAAHALGKLSIGANGTVLGSSGSAPQWVNPNTLALQASQIEALFTADQQIFSGTGNGTGEIIDLMNALREYSGSSVLALVGKPYAAAGDIITGTVAGVGAVLTVGASVGDALRSAGSGQVPTWGQATTQAGVLGSNYTVTGSETAFLSIASLAVGKWLVTLSGTYSDVNGQCEIRMTNTGTMTFAGQQAVSLEGGTSQGSPFSITTLVTVTAAGQVSWTAKGSGTFLILTATPANSYANATGYTATRL